MYICKNIEAWKVCVILCCNYYNYVFMILSDRKTLDALIEGNMLQINSCKHQRSWEYYQKQYHRVFYVLLDVAKQKRYKTNSIFMPFMFIMRHSLELYLKNKIHNMSGTIPNNTHSITELYESSKIREGVFLQSFDIFECKSEGACWRYLDYKGNKYFEPGKSIEVFDICNSYCLLFGNDDFLIKDVGCKKLRWELTFHTDECYTLGQVATQYDLAITVVLEEIKIGRVLIHDIYLPLLFLLRHSLELKLKFSIMRLGNFLKGEDVSKAEQRHNVNKLYTVLFEKIEPLFSVINDSDLKEETKSLYTISETYKERIASLDANSYHFRFPKNNSGGDSNFVPKADCVSEILKLYYESDSFLCFILDVLSDVGALRNGDGIEEK